MPTRNKPARALPLRATFAWFGLFTLAFVNGALREAVMKPILGIGEPLAHQLSCITGIALWTSFTVLIWKKLNVHTLRESALVGTGWFFATVFTEVFLLNKLIGKMSWEQILQTYNVMAGDFWALVLLWIGFMPVMIYKLARRV